jgi:hypothetical protein
LHLEDDIASISQQNRTTISKCPKPSCINLSVDNVTMNSKSTRHQTISEKRIRNSRIRLTVRKPKKRDGQKRTDNTKKTTIKALPSTERNRKPHSGNQRKREAPAQKQLKNK